MATCNELSQLLDNDGEPISKRLRLAENVFLSSQLAIPNKEEVIFDWLCRQASKSPSKKRSSNLPDAMGGLQTLWNTLQSCIRSNRIHRFSVLDLPLTSKRATIQVLCEHLNKDYKDDTELLSLCDCAVSVLESASFQRYLKDDIPLFSNFLQSIFKSLQYAFIETNLKLRIVMAIRGFYRESILRSDINAYFLKSALFPLINLIVEKDGNTSQASLVAEVRKCFDQIMFPKSSVEFVQFLDELFRHDKKKVPDLKAPKLLDRHQHSVPFHIIEALQESHETYSEEAIVLLYSTIFQCFLGSLKTNTSPSAFQMFLCLCHLVGIRAASLKCKVDDKKLRDCFKQAISPPSSLSLNILVGLVNVLSSKGAPLNSEINGTRFLDWLQTIVGSLFPQATEQVEKIQLYKLFASFTKLNPFTVEANVENILNLVSRKPITENEMSACSEMLGILLIMFHKMNRVHKFVGIYLTCLENGIMSYSNETNAKCLDLWNWIPSEIFVKLTEFSTMMPSEAAIKIFETLSDHLTKIVNSLIISKHQGQHSALSLQVVCEMLCSMFKGVRLVENSVAPRPRMGFCKVLGDLRDDLFIMGHSVLKAKNLSSLKCFLKLAYHWGAEALLIKQYATVGRDALVESLSSEKAVTNGKISLSYIHPYLTDDEWQSVRNESMAFGDPECLDLLEKLDFQLLCALQLLENSIPIGMSDLVKQCLAHFLHKRHFSDYDTLFKKEVVFDLLLLSRMLSTSEIIELSEYLVPLLLTQHKQHNFLETMSLLTERRPLACALIFSTLNNLERGLKAFKRKRSETSISRFMSSRAVLHDLKGCSKFFIEAEINQSSEVPPNVKSVLVSMTKVVSDMLSASIDVNEEEEVEESGGVNLQVIKDHLTLLQALPLQCLLAHSRVGIFLSFLGLAVDCNQVPPSPDRNLILSVLYDRIFVGLAERKLLLRKHQHFNQHLLDRYLAHNCVSVNVPRHLLEVLMSEALEDENALDYVHETVSFLTKKTSKIKMSKENILISTILLQNIVGRKRIFESNASAAKDGSQPEKIRSTVENLIHYLCLLIEEHHGKPKDLMHLFALSLDFLVKSKMMDTFKKSLAPSLEDYCSVAVSKLQSSNTYQQKAAEALLATVFVHHKTLEEFIPSSLLRDVWSTLVQMQNPTDGPVKLMSHYVSRDIIDELILKTVETYRALDSSDVELPSSSVMDLWCALINCTNSLKANSDLWQSAIRRLLDELHTLNRIPPNSLLKFLHRVVSTTEIIMDMEMTDQCLLALNGVSLPVTVSEFSALGEKYLTVLSALFFHRQVFALDSVPNLIQKLQILIRKLGHQSRVRDDLSPADISNLADLAYNVEKFVSSFTRPDFKVSLKRVAAYLIADVISVFEVVTLCSSVKVHFQNMVYILISMIDKHSIQFLLRAMSPASNEIFKSLYATYTKFHAFKGKI